MKVLAICIPTYNRKEKLKELFDSIFNQTNQFVLSKIEIHVFDNCSNDGTDLFVKNYSFSHSNITYHRNSSNLGADGNFLEILRSDLNCQFFHLISDDDLYLPNTLLELVSFLSLNTNCDFIYANFCYFSEGTFQPSLKHKTLSNNFKSFNRLSKQSFLDLINNEFSFLSGMIFNKKSINTNLLENYLGTHWLQSYCFFLSTKNSSNNLGFFGKPLVGKRCTNESVDYDLTAVFGENFYNLVVFGYSKCGYKKSQLLHILDYVWSRVIYDAKRRGKFNKTNKSLSFVINKSKHNLNLLMVYYMCFIPSNVYSLYYNIRKIK